MLDVARLAVRKFHFHLLRTLWRFRRRAGRPGRNWRSRLFGFRLNRLAVPFGITEMQMRLHEIINREVILSVIQPRAAPNNPVSYTHLDVYKRQVLATIITSDGKARKHASVNFIVPPRPRLSFT